MFTENELPDGWILLSENSARTMKEELHREICNEHILHGKVVYAIARREDRDDVLFSVKDIETPLCTVHLTWSQESKPDWPFVTFFASKYDFIHNWNRIFE